MSIKQSKSISATQRYWNIIRNGLFLFGLAMIGLDIRPYYLVQEEVEKCKEPIIKENPSDYMIKYLNLDEVKLIVSSVPNVLGEDLIKGFNNGQSCVGLLNNNEIAAFTFNFIFSKRAFKLKDNEAYLLNMWTFHSFRGKNLAPYLRYQSYQLLEEQGREVKFSITEYFNKLSIKFKKKLNSKHLKLFISIILFKKYHWNFELQEYK